MWKCPLIFCYVHWEQDDYIRVLLDLWLTETEFKLHLLKNIFYQYFKRIYFNQKWSMACKEIGIKFSNLKVGSLYDHLCHFIHKKNLLCPPRLFLTLCPCKIFHAFCHLLFFFKINFFKKYLQQYHLSVKQIGSRSGPTLSLAWSGSKLFSKVSSRRHSVGSELRAG